MSKFTWISMFFFIFVSLLTLPVLKATQYSLSLNSKSNKSILYNQENRLLNTTASLLKIDFNYENCSEGSFTDSVGIFGRFSSVCQFKAPAFTNSTPYNSKYQSCCLSSNGIWNKFTKVISTFGRNYTSDFSETTQQTAFWKKFSSRLTATSDSATQLSTYFRVAPPQIPASNEINEIFSLGNCKFCGYNLKISLITGIHNSSFLNSSTDQYYNQLKLEICVETRKIKLLSDTFPLSSRIIDDRKAILASVSVKNFIIFIPPFFQLYQLQAQFFQVHSISSNKGQFKIYNSTGYYFSTESLFDINSWGSHIVNVTDSSGAIYSHNSFAEIFPLSNNAISKLTFQQGWDQKSFDSNLCTSTSSFRYRSNGYIETSPLNATCGVILYSLNIVNVVDFVQSEWKYLLYNDYPLTSVVALETSVSVSEVGMKNSVVNYFNSPSSFENLPKSIELPTVVANMFVWVPSYEESFMSLTRGQSANNQFTVIVDGLQSNMYENCHKNLSTRFQDLVYFSNSSELKSSCGEIYFSNGSILSLSHSSSVILRQDVPSWNSSIVTIPLLYRPPYGQVSFPSSYALDTLYFQALWTNNQQKAQLSNGRVDLAVKHILKPIRPYPLMQHYRAVSRVVTILRIDFVTEIYHLLSKIEFTSLPQRSTFYCLPQRLLSQLNKNDTHYMSLNINSTLLRTLATDESAITPYRRSCMVYINKSGDSSGNYEYRKFSTYVAFLFHGKENRTGFTNTTYHEANDTASFNLHGLDNSSSITGILSIAVIPSIQLDTIKIQKNLSSNNIILRTNGNGYADFNIFCHDLATFHARPVMSEMIQQPRFGTMMKKTNSPTLSFPPYETPIQYQYRYNVSSKHFSIPTITARGLPITTTRCPFIGFDTIVLHAVSSDNVDYSLPLTIPIELKNFNDPTIISVLPTVSSLSPKGQQLRSAAISSAVTYTPVTRIEKKYMPIPVQEKKCWWKI